MTITYGRIPERRLTGQRLGRQLHHDSRSWSYRLRAKAQDPLVDTDFPPGIPCTDQGDLGECVAESTTEQLSTPLFHGIAGLDVLDEDFSRHLYAECTQNDPYPGAWSYSEPHGDDTGTDGLTAAKVCVARGYASGYQHIMDMPTLLALTQKRGSIVGMPWKAGCDNPDRQGLIRYTGALRGGHELYVRGYDAGRQWFRLQNHWTAEWGVEGGCCYISVADLAQALDDQGDVTVILPATVPAPQPGPNPTDPYAELRPAFDAWAPTGSAKLTKKSRAARDAWLANR